MEPHPLTHILLCVRGDVTVVGRTVGCAGTVIYSRTLYHQWKLCNYICFNPSLCICLHRQQVPERNQKKKKKMKWRAERSASSHRFHCAILWPLSSCLFFRLKHTHVNLNSLEGARCRGLSLEHKNDGRREKRMGTVGPSRCLWMMPSPVHYLCCLSRTFNQFIQNQHWKCSRSLPFLTFISNAAQDGRRQDKAERSTSPWLLELLYLLGKGRKKDWHSTTTHISTPTQVLRGTHLYVASPSFGNRGWIWTWGRRKKKWCGAVERHAAPQSAALWDFKCHVFVRRTCCRMWKKGDVTSAVGWTLWSYRCLDIVIVIKIEVGQCIYTLM